MKITERRIENIVILDLEGQMTLGIGDEDLTERIKLLLSQGAKNFILNGADQPYIDSAGLGAITASHRRVEQHGGYLKLLNPSKRVIDLLMITKFTFVFEVFEDENEAVCSFSTQPTQS